MVDGTHDAPLGAAAMMFPLEGCSSPSLGMALIFQCSCRALLRLISPFFYQKPIVLMPLEAHVFFNTVRSHLTADTNQDIC